MRSYVFTEKEREFIEAFLRGEVKTSDNFMRKLLFRVRSFSDLSRDVDLYMKIRSRIAKS